jgi:hypothetical protein
MEDLPEVGEVSVSAQRGAQDFAEIALYPGDARAIWVIEATGGVIACDEAQ